MDEEYYYSHFSNDFRERVEVLRIKIKKCFKPVKEIFRKYYIAYSKEKIFCYIWFTSKTVYIYLGLEPSIKKGLLSVPKGVHSFFRSRYLYQNINQVDEIIKLIQLSIH